MMSSQALRASKSSVSSSHVVMSLVAGMAALLLLLALQGGLVDDIIAYIGLTVVVLGYCTAQAKLAYEEDGRLVVINPAVAATLVTAFFQLGIGNLIWFVPEDIFRRAPDNMVIDYWVDYYLALWTLAFVGLWSGYRSQWARETAASIAASRFLRNWLHQTGSLHVPFVFVLVGVSLLCRLLLISFGIFGYSSIETEMERTLAFRQFLTMGADVGKFALVAVALCYFSQSGSRERHLPLLVMLVVYEVFFGLLSGFKSQVVMPVVLVGFLAFLVTGRVPRNLILLAVCALVLAYALIEPFRAIRSEDTFAKYELAQMTEGVFTARGTADAESEEQFSLDAGIAHFIGTRFGIGVYSRGLKYASENEPLPAGSPEFLTDIFVAPAMSVIPRAIWSEKPEANHGAWYAREVFGMIGNTAVGMSPVTYLYFAGGPLAVFIGFLIFGMFQRVLFHGLLAFGIGGLLLFLGLSDQVRALDSTYYDFISNTMRLLPALLIAQHFLIKPASSP